MTHISTTYKGRAAMRTLWNPRIGRRLAKAALAVVGLATMCSGFIAGPARAQGTGYVEVPGHQVDGPLSHYEIPGYGGAVATGDFNGDGIDDVAIGDPGFDTRVDGYTLNDTGRVTVWYGRAGGGYRDDPQIFDLSSEWDYVLSYGYQYGYALAAGDFNRDGYVDLAVGIPGAWVLHGLRYVPEAGSVEILPGTWNGLTRDFQLWSVIAWEAQRLDQSSVCPLPTEPSFTAQPLCGSRPEEAEHFGRSLAAGDFDGDGVDDLAVGAPDENVYAGGMGLLRWAGEVDVLYGKQGPCFIVPLPGATGICWGGGLDGSRSQRWNLYSALQVGFYPGYVSGELRSWLPVKKHAIGMDAFGWSLAAGNFGGDEADDLAVGIPFNDPGELSAGAVLVLYGGKEGPYPGLRRDGAQYIHQDTGGVPGVVEDGDLFGWSLAAGNFNGACPPCDPEYEDLAIGVPGEGVAGKSGAGAVNVLYGARAGLHRQGAPAAEIWHQNKETIKGGAEPDDNFGYSLATGKFDSGCSDDLAIGVPGEDIASNSIKGAGMVNVIYGSFYGLDDLNNQAFHRRSTGIRGAAEDSDSFGWAIGTGYLVGDDFADLVVGVPFDDRPGRLPAFNTIYGSSSGLSPSGNQLTHAPYWQ